MVAEGLYFQSSLWTRQGDMWGILMTPPLPAQGRGQYTVVGTQLGAQLEFVGSVVEL